MLSILAFTTIDRNTFREFSKIYFTPFPLARSKSEQHPLSADRSIQMVNKFLNLVRAEEIN
jgi:hypothetical protein